MVTRVPCIGSTSPHPFKDEKMNKLGRVGLVLYHSMVYDHPIRYLASEQPEVLFSTSRILQKEILDFANKAQST